MEPNFAFLCNDIARMFRKRFDEAARGVRIVGTGVQWRVLLILKHRPGINQGQLAEMMDVEPITACRMVDRLEQSGLIERRRDPEDRRAWRLFLTDAALPVILEMREIGQRITKSALARLSDDDVNRVIEALVTVRETLSMAEDEHAAGREAHHG